MGRMEKRKELSLFKETIGKERERERRENWCKKGER